MTYRHLGKDGPAVSSVGLGTWPLAGGMGSVQRSTAIRTIRAAIDAGMTFIDTAQGYREGEKILGDALREVPRDTYFMATKVSRVYDAAAVRAAAENSLTSLGVDVIDLYQIHSYPEDVPVEQTLDEIIRLRDEGKVRFIGVSNFTVAQLTRAAAHTRIVSNQLNYNLFLRTIEDEMLPFCEKEGIAVIVHSALGKGLLGGRHKPGHRFADDDERSRFGLYRGDKLERYLSAAAELAAFAGTRGHSLPEMAIAWTLRHTAVASTLAGPKSPEQLSDPVAAGDDELSASDIEAIEEILNRHKPPMLLPWNSVVS